jgi:23S rRNA (cytidine1920-2'-O)/16S rRNA (cytidine1409-2'-O)-methyltransferase
MSRTREPRRRADLLLVERGLFESRARAQEAIAAGLVSADGAPVVKASDRLPADAAIAAAAPHPWASRAGVKLQAALDAFGIDPAGRVCLDLGASTGGFTDVLLTRGAAKIYAVDVGHGQLHPRLIGNARVTSLEGTDARHLTRALISDPIGLLVVDVSFISLRLVLPPVIPLLVPDAALVALIKPQFEAGRGFVRKGLIRDEAVHRTVCRETAAFAEALGFKILGLIPSPILGGDGNREFLIGAKRGERDERDERA